MKRTPQNIAWVLINMVIPYLKKHKLRIQDTKLTPELFLRFVDILKERSKRDANKKIK